MLNIIKSKFEESINLKKQVLTSELLVRLVDVIDVLIDAFQKNKKVLFCGNGGSAADAQHMAAELVNRFYLNRAPLAAIALTTDTSVITSIANDFSYDDIFSKQVEALGSAKDVLIAISTSGKSKNVLKSIEIAKKMGLVTICFTGQGPNPLIEHSDYSVEVPSLDTPRIQEVHQTLLHIVCEIVEFKLFGKHE